jgi:predicted TIM-barrel fold metal-dependent hydrolase
MPVIDVHTHIFPDHVAPKAMPALEAGANVKATFDGTLAGLLAAMDRAGIDRAVLQPVATKPDQVRSINDWTAGIVSERIIPFGAIHPELDDPAAEVARMRGLGILGIKMHPEYQEFWPHEERLWPIYDAVIEHGMVILFHAGIDIEIPTLRGTPESFAQMLDDRPRLRAILAHMGGFRQWDEVRWHLAGRDVCLDTSYTLGHMEDTEFVELVKAHGADKIVFGTDGPWTDMRAEVDAVRSLPLPQAEQDAIFCGNATRLLGL